MGTTLLPLSQHLIVHEGVVCELGKFQALQELLLTSKRKLTTALLLNQHLIGDEGAILSFRTGQDRLGLGWWYDWVVQNRADLRLARLSRVRSSIRLDLDELDEESV